MGGDRLQRYKLRLADGTVLVVDHDGLSTWLVDKKAMVQLVGSRQWRPLKEFLAEERAVARYAARRKPTAREALPLIPPPPPKDEAPSPPADSPPGEPQEGPSIGEPPGVQVLADEPTGADGGLTGRGSNADQALPSISPQPREDETPWGIAASTPSEWAEGPSLSEPPGVQVPSDEPAFHTTEPVSNEPARDDEIAEISLPRDDEAPAGPAASPWSESIEPEPPSIRERPSLQVLADDPVRDGFTGRTSTPDDGLPIIQLKPVDGRDEAPAQTFAGSDQNQEDWALQESTQPPILDERLLRPFFALGDFLSHWIDRLARQGRRLPSIWTHEPAQWRPGSAERDAPLEPPLSGEPPMVRVLAEEPTGPGTGYARAKPTADEASPIPALKALDEEEVPRRSAAQLQALLSRASEWVGVLGRWVERLSAWIERVTRRDRPSPTVPPNEAAAPSLAAPAPREPLKAPPPLHELPIIRLAEVDEPKVAEHIYEGEDEGERESLFHAAWLWTKRIVVITALVAAGILAALSWETWVPRAWQLARLAFTEIDDYTRARTQTQRQRRALQEATEQLPQLAPETIQLILSGSPTGALDPPEVFRVACNAVDRGLSALTPAEAQELKALRRQLLDTLGDAERELVREYDRARANRLTFPFEDRSVLGLVARGARRLPSRSRERLQELSGKAITAGLVLPAAPSAAAQR